LKVIFINNYKKFIDGGFYINGFYDFKNKKEQLKFKKIAYLKV
jgi:hypothetical protein